MGVLRRVGNRQKQQKRLFPLGIRSTVGREGAGSPYQCPASRIRVYSSARTRFCVLGSPAWEMQLWREGQIRGSTCKHRDVANEELQVNAVISLRVTFCL